MESEESTAQQSTRTGTGELASEYANNSFLEPSIWDIKVFFGQGYQGPKPETDWHTAVTIPWLQAKLLAHFLQVNVAIHEAEHGTISVPLSFQPAPPAGPVSGSLEVAVKMHNNFFKGNQ